VELLPESVKHHRGNRLRAATAVPWRFDGCKGAQIGANVLDSVNTAASCVSHLRSRKLVTQDHVELPESRAVRCSGRAVCASDGDSQEEAGSGPAFHADQYGQPSLYLESTKSECRGYSVNEAVCTAESASAKS
jgi:hypothetical protein